MANSAFSQSTINVPVSVTNGGTGATSLTAYAPIFGGTTSTGAVQSGTVGTSGQILTSNGAGALPTFQNAATGGTVDNGVQNFRLTLVSGTPVMTSDQTAKTTIYLTPYTGNRIALYDGSSAWSVITSAEVSLSLSGYTANSNYDIWAYNNSGTLTLESTIWTDDTTRATALAYQDGVLVKSGTTTRRYIGTIRTTGTTGQTAFVFSPSASPGGTAGQLFVWNYYNRVSVEAVVRDSTDSWTYSTGAWRAANNSTGNRVNFVIGVQESSMNATYLIIGTVGIGGAQCYSGIGYDSTTAITGASGMLGGSGGTVSSIPAARGSVIPGIGSHYISALEYGANSVTFYGDDGTPLVRQGGLFVQAWY